MEKDHLDDWSPEKDVIRKPSSGSSHLTLKMASAQVVERQTQKQLSNSPSQYFSIHN